MSFSRNDSSIADQPYSAGNPPRLLAVHCAILLAAFGLAVGKTGTPTLVADSVQAEFVALNQEAAPPIVLAQPALVTRTARAN